MAQQINLCTPIFLKEKRYFSANAIAQGLAVIILFACALSAYWVMSLQSAAQTFAGFSQNNQREIESLQAVIKTNRANAGPADAALVQELQFQRKTLLQKEQQLIELRRGLYKDGFGHSARLQWVAQSVPNVVWVTEVKTDEVHFSLSGYTLEPAALNAWVSRLAASPLLQGQPLSTVKVERAVNPVAGSARLPPNVWSFTLVSSVLASSGDRP